MAKMQVRYRIGELAQMMGLSRYQAAKTMEANGIPIRRIGRVRVVYLSAIKVGLPEIWESMLDLAAME